MPLRSFRLAFRLPLVVPSIRSAVEGVFYQARARLPVRVRGRRALGRTAQERFSCGHRSGDSAVRTACTKTPSPAGFTSVPLLEVVSTPKVLRVWASASTRISRISFPAAIACASPTG